MPEQDFNLAKMRFLARRGLKELDILLNRYLEQHFLHATVQEKKAFMNLLRLDDHSLLLMILQAEKKSNICEFPPSGLTPCEQKICLKINQLQLNTNSNEKS